jgi:DNA polymerase-4
MPRSILYIDPPAFCTTVEALVAPALRGRPVAVAAPGADRATILALSAEARAAGIAPGMAVRLARKRCPDLLLLPPNPELYARASRALHEVLQVYAPVIEPHGFGHAFLDLTGTTRLFGLAVDVAARITREARARIRLPLTVGVARNKLVSEAATRVGRLAAPISLIEVPEGDEAPFLAPQAIAVLPDLPAEIRERLDEYHLCRIGEVAAIREADLCAVFGRRGAVLRQQARGIDPRPVLPPELRADFRATHTLATDTNDRTILHPLLRRLTEQLGGRLRRRGLAAHRMRVAAIGITKGRSSAMKPTCATRPSSRTA